MQMPGVPRNSLAQELDWLRRSMTDLELGKPFTKLSCVAAPAVYNT